MRLAIGAMCVFGVLATGAPSWAAILVQSTFDTNDEGWRVGDLVVASVPVSPTYVATGGNPGAFIRTGDQFSSNAYIAPAAFLGNQSAAYAGNLHLEERIVSSDGTDLAMVIISDGLLHLQFRTAPPPNNVFTLFDIPLLASAGWEIASNGVSQGPAATEAQLQQVLGALTALRIEADWASGQDQVDLDNVRLESPDVAAVPEPATLAIWSVGVFGLVGAAFRRRKRMPSVQ